MIRNKSGIKRDRQGKIRKERNRILKSRVRTAYNKVVDALDDNNKDILNNNLNNYFSEIDKAIKKGVFHRNKGARRKSNIYKKIHSYIKTGTTESAQSV